MDATNNVFRLYGTTTPATVWQIGLANGTMTLPSLSSITTGSLQAAAPSAAAGYAIDADSNQFRVFNPANAARMLQFGLTTGVLRLPAIDANTTGSLQGTAPASAAGYVIDAFGNQFRVYNPADATRMLQFGLTTNTLQVGTATVITSATIGAQNVAGASNASQLGGMSPGNGAGQIPISNNLLCTQLIASGANNANQLNGQGPAFYQARANHTGTQLAATISDLASQTVAGASNSTSVGGRVPTATPTANAIPISDAAGKLDAWITAFTPGAYVPQGLIAMLEDTNPANMPAGWSRYTAANGMLIVGDGTTFSQTFTATNNYGSAWSHGHTDAGHGHGNVDHNHGATLLTVTGHTGTVSTSTPSVNVTSGAGGETYVPDHTHDAATGGGTLDVGGTTDSRTSLTVPTGTAAIGGTTWFPPMRSLMYIRKN